MKKSKKSLDAVSLKPRLCSVHFHSDFAHKYDQPFIHKKFNILCFKFQDMDCKAACMVHCNKISELLNQKQTNKLLHKARDTVTLLKRERVQFSYLRNARRSMNILISEESFLYMIALYIRHLGNIISDK